MGCGFITVMSVAQMSGVRAQYRLYSDDVMRNMMYAQATTGMHQQPKKERYLDDMLPTALGPLPDLL